MSSDDLLAQGMQIAENIARKACRGDEDAISEAYVGVTKALQSFDERKGPWKPWVITHVKTALLTYKRSKSRVLRGDHVTAPPKLHIRPNTLRYEAGPDPMESVHVKDAIDRLPPMESVAMSMWYISDEDATAIAKRLDVNERKVRRLREKGREHLRDSM